MQTQTIKLETIKDTDNSVMIFILEPPKASTKVLGRTFSQWVSAACGEYSNASIVCEKFSFDFLKQYLTNSKYTIVLLNSLILLTPNAVKNLVDYITVKGVKACKFSGGYVFETQYLKTAKDVFYDSVYYNDQQAFYIVDDRKQLKFATEILQERIYAEHIINGVEIQNACIEADVKIGKGTIIFGGNIIKGNTVIGNNCVIKEKNIIENSTIGNECCVSGSTILNSALEDGVFVKPYCYVEKSLLRKNTLVDSNMRLIDKKTRANAKIKQKEE